MLTLRTEIEIDAPVARVWAVLTDFAAFPRWNPFIRRVDGRPAERTRLSVTMQPPGGRAMTFHPTVVRVDDERHLSWRGRTLIPGVFDGHHYFELEPLGPERTRVVHGENFSGVLVPLLATTLRTTTRRGFERMNAALKARAEAFGRGTLLR
jgi:hypothetical protein